MDRRWFAVPTLLAVLVLGAIAIAQEDIEPLHGGQQEVEILNPPQQQVVEAVDQTAVQDVAKHEVPTQSQRTVSAVGKFAVAVLGLAVAIGASAASLIFL
jgi:hypothetical protein